MISVQCAALFVSSFTLSCTKKALPCCLCIMDVTIHDAFGYSQESECGKYSIPVDDHGGAVGNPL